MFRFLDNLINARQEWLSQNTIPPVYKYLRIEPLGYKCLQSNSESNSKNNLIF